jgi:hypothetical protein
MSRAHMVFIIFFVTASLILTVYLRNASSRTYFEYRVALSQQDRLKEQLKRKQLELESLVHPGIISEQLEDRSDQQP